jgi:hypothetical protein
MVEREAYLHAEMGISAAVSGYRTAATTTAVAYVGAGLYKRGTAPGKSADNEALSMIIHIKTGNAEERLSSPKIGKCVWKVKRQHTESLHGEYPRKA